MFKNGIEMFSYFAKQCDAFKVAEKWALDLEKENNELKENHQQAIGELAKTKIENMQIKTISQKALSELAATKIKLMQIENKLNEKEGK